MYNKNLRLKCAFIIKKIINNKFTLNTIFKYKDKNKINKNFIFIKNKCFNIMRNYIFINYIIKYKYNKIIKNNSIIYYILFVIIFDMYYLDLKKYIIFSEIKKMFISINIKNIYKNIVKYLNYLYNKKNKILMNNNNIIYYIQSIKNFNYNKSFVVINKIINKSENIKNINNILLKNKNLYTWIRINKNIIKNNTFYKILKKNNINFKIYNKIPFCIGIKNYNISKNNRILNNMYNKGLFSIQNISSQKCVYILNPQKKDIILDMCASPGNKTCHILEICPNIKKLISIEKNKHRINYIIDNIKRLKIKNNNNFKIENKNSIYLNEEYYNKFNKILIDAPCTSTGNIYNKPDCIFKSKKIFYKLIKEQKKLIKKSLKYLKKGGCILYSTCSILDEENKYQIKKIINKNKNLLLIINKKNQNIIGIKSIYNNKLDNEGFFYSKIKKLY